MKQYDVIALGELMIDLTQNGISVQGNLILEANPGGAPCNVLLCLAKLGHRAAFIGKVEQDNFSVQLRQAIEEACIATEGLCQDERVHTILLN